MDEARVTVESFLAAGRSVCPFAKSSVPHVVSVTAAPRADRQVLLEAAREFARSVGAAPNHVLIVLGPSMVEYDATKAWAIDAFLELYVVFTVLAGVVVPDAERWVERQIKPLLLSDADPRRPMLACGNEPLFAICMAPVYPEQHPRYSPIPVLVVTWLSDVARAQKGAPAVLQRIREKMREGHGSLYDADELMLPLPT